MVGVGVFLLIANLANKERVIPELMSSGGRSDVESFDTLTTMTTGAAQTEVNPTTASIITSILITGTMSSTYNDISTTIS